MNSEKIIKVLRDKKATLPCPACGHDGFTLVDGDFTQEFIHGEQPAVDPLGGMLGLTSSGRRSLNYIVLVCDNCGYLRQHAKKPLGIPTRKV